MKALRVRVSCPALYPENPEIKITTTRTPTAHQFTGTRPFRGRLALSSQTARPRWSTPTRWFWRVRRVISSHCWVRIGRRLRRIIWTIARWRKKDAGRRKEKKIEFLLTEKKIISARIEVPLKLNSRWRISVDDFPLMNSRWSPFLQHMQNTQKLRPTHQGPFTQNLSLHQPNLYRIKLHVHRIFKVSRHK